MDEGTLVLYVCVCDMCVSVSVCVFVCVCGGGGYWSAEMAAWCVGRLGPHRGMERGGVEFCAWGVGRQALDLKGASAPRGVSLIVYMHRTRCNSCLLPRHASVCVCVHFFDWLPSRGGLCVCPRPAESRLVMKTLGESAGQSQQLSCDGRCWLL